MVSNLSKSIIKVVLLVFLCVTCPVYAMDSAAVIGSYQNLRNAQQVQHSAQDYLSLDATIMETEVSASVWYRVVVRHSKARALVSELRQQGFGDAWLLNDLTSVVDTIPGAPPDQNPSQWNIEKSADEVAVLRVEPHPVVPTENPGNSEPQARGFDRERLVQTIEGIPVHEIVVSNFPHADVGIKLDGHVDEEIWLNTPSYDNMIVYVPATGEAGHYPTETRMIATNNGLYVSAVMYQPPETLVSRMSTRDDFIDRDTFGITLDTSGEGLMGYWFIVALGDSLMDGKVLPERNYQRDWDGPWRAKTARLDYGWSVELFLPWSMMNMPQKDGARNVGFAVSRQVAHMMSPLRKSACTLA